MQQPHPIERLYVTTTGGKDFSPASQAPALGDEYRWIEKLLINLSALLETEYDLNGSFSILLHRNSFATEGELRFDIIDHDLENPGDASTHSMEQLEAFFWYLQERLELVGQSMSGFETFPHTKDGLLKYRFSNPYPLVFAFSQLATAQGYDTDIYDQPYSAITEDIEKNLLRGNFLNEALCMGFFQPLALPYSCLEILDDMTLLYGTIPSVPAMQPAPGWNQTLM